jgi:hypothetical protein
MGRLQFCLAAGFQRESPQPIGNEENDFAVRRFS